MKLNLKIAMVSLFGVLLVMAASAGPLPQSQEKAQPRMSSPDQPYPEQRGRIGEMFGRRLGLTPDQQSRIDALRKSHGDARMAAGEEMRKLDDQLRALRDDPKADPKKADALIDNLMRLRADEMKSGFRFRQDFMNILTPEQREKLTSMRSRFMGRMPEGRFGYGGFFPFLRWGFGGFMRPFMGRYFGGIFGGFGGFHRGFRGFGGRGFDRFHGVRHGSWRF